MRDFTKDQARRLSNARLLIAFAVLEFWIIYLMNTNGLTAN